MHCHLAVVMAAMSNAIEMHLDRNDGITGQFPLFHCAAHVLLLTYLSVGGKLAIMRGFDPVACMEAIQRDRLTIFIGLPAMYQAILDHPRRKEFDLSTLRTCVYTMAPMPRPLLERCIAELARHSCSRVDRRRCIQRPPCRSRTRQLARFGNYWGKSMIVNETAIMDDEGNLLPPGQVGEIVHRGPECDDGLLQGPRGNGSGAEIRLASHWRSGADRRTR